MSLTPPTTETLFALGVGDRIVGKVEDLSLYPPEAAAIPDVAKFGEVDVEKIVSLEPDLVIAGGNSFNPPDKIAQLRQLGVPVIVLYAPDIDTVFSDIELTGAAVGQRGRGEGPDDLDAGRFRPGRRGDELSREAARLLRARRDAARSTPPPTTRSSPR